MNDTEIVKKATLRQILNTSHLKEGMKRIIYVKVESEIKKARAEGKKEERERIIELLENEGIGWEIQGYADGIGTIMCLVALIRGEKYEK